MSIYSGFATRQLEETYNNLISMLIQILSKRIIKFYINEPCHEPRFRHGLQQISLKLKSLEQQKYLDPKFSISLEPLFKHVQVLDSQEQFSFNEKLRNRQSSFFFAQPKQLSPKRKKSLCLTRKSCYMN
ncbi:hypothetical protein pb186bvf_014573 [Paramecium bursaria]